MADGTTRNRRDAGSLSTSDARITFGISLVAGFLSVALVGVGARMLLSPEDPTDDMVDTASVSTGEVPHPIDLAVRSTTPEAALLFRGNILPLPYRAHVPSSDTPELIEVTAPHHQGRRFWVKLDRTRRMLVILPAGDGSVDATYEETGTALSATR
jgi:hypothetical protein